MEKAYDPKKTESRIYKLWQKSGFFNPDKLPGKRTKTFVIMMAPPNITGHIHVGHALENTLSDILIRQKRMLGYKTLFLPGKDHAGIAAQFVVEKQLRKEELSRFDLGREKFLERMRQWMKEYGDSIDKELKKFGLSCDWSRKRFTMDKGYQEAVKAAFDHYQKKGWIYRGKRIVNWCSRCKTSISDLEVEYNEEKSKLWFIKYPLAQDTGYRIQDAGYIIVATTRPETMLGDAAVAVNPKDDRYEDLIGRKAVLPIKNRVIPIIADELVDKSFGTGAVKVTPAHDSIDFEIAGKHNLPFYYVIDEEGKMTVDAGICAGLSVNECRTKVIEILKTEGLLEKEENYLHNVGVCERCKTVIEPLISKQWFLSMKELAESAIKAAQKNEIKFIPSTRKDIFINWFNNIKDWNISRQLWWGHRIPIQGEEDVLDTWFSSALWPFATLGWPESTKDLKTFYPAAVISSAREIFFLWISRMVFSGLEFMKKAPFKVIYIHPTILDKYGRKMSKSLGNIVDPMELINKYGIDATRFGLVWQATGHQDIHFSEDAFVAGKKFCNKIWNAARFILMNKPPRINADLQRGFTRKNKNLTKADKEILKKLDEITEETGKCLEKYEFGQALHKLYDFFWRDFCDKFIEASKKENTAESKQILFHVLANSLKLLHPFIPFITEEIYQIIQSSSRQKSKKLLLIEKYPTLSR